MRLLVTGASGLLGLNLCLAGAAQGYAVTGLVNLNSLQGVPFDVRAVDLLETEKAIAAIEDARPEAIIHCAAVANLNAAEGNPKLAERLNGEVPGMLAGAARKWGIPFIHISTDAVFDGRRSGYMETDPPNPLSVYARTKLQGEEAVMASSPDAIIIRTVFYGWSLSGKRSLAEFFINNLKEGKSLKGFTDTSFCPLYVEDLAEVLLEMLTADLHGIYHVVSPEHLSKYAFGVRLANAFGFDSDLIAPVEVKDISRGATRSNTLVLNPDKIQRALGHPMASIESGIRRFYQRWQEGYPARLMGYTG
jgi:dTDP-4-dehydrorhamnose reductase